MKRILILFSAVLAIALPSCKKCEKCMTVWDYNNGWQIKNTATVEHCGEYLEKIQTEVKPIKGENGDTIGFQSWLCSF